MDGKGAAGPFGYSDPVPFSTLEDLSAAHGTISIVRVQPRAALTVCTRTHTALSAAIYIIKCKQLKYFSVEEQINCVYSHNIKSKRASLYESKWEV